MKTERRHDLETNSLAVQLTGWIETLKPHASKLLGILSIVVALIAIYTIWNSRSAAQQELAWDEFAKAKNTTDPELMNMQKLALAEEYVGTAMQDWAQVTWADGQLSLAARGYLVDRKAALSRLRSVQGLYRNLTVNSNDLEIRDRAHFGLGRVYELQNKLDDAREHYAKVQGDLSPIAAQRSEQLADEKIGETFDWLASAKLPKRDLTAAQGASGERPAFDASVPDTTPGDAPAKQGDLEKMLEDFKIDSDEETPAEGVTAEDVAEEAASE